MSASVWETRTFEELFTVPLRSGLNRPTQTRGSGIKMVNMGELFAHDRIADPEMDRVELSERETGSFLLQEGDLLFARQSLKRSWAGKCSLVLASDEPRTWEGHLIRVRLDKSQAMPTFYYYFFRSLQGRSLVESIIEQVAAAGIRGSDLRRLVVPYPPLEEQKRIAATLSALDEKIELNRRIDVTLEGIARAIFKSWFVDFDPVLAKMEGREPLGMDTGTASLFLDSLLESELGPIPKGWSVGVLGEVADNFRRQITPSQLEVPKTYIGLEHMPRRSIALGDWATSEGLGSNKFGFERGEILFGKLRPYFHKVGVAPVDGVCSTDILVIAPRTPEWHSFVLGHVSSDELVAHANATSTGTRMPRTNWKDLSSYRIAIPPVDVASAFNELASPIVEAIIGNIHEVRNLAAIRDTLLPKLISGEVRIRDAEQMAEAAL